MTNTSKPFRHIVYMDMKLMISFSKFFLLGSSSFLHILLMYNMRRTSNIVIYVANEIKNVLGLFTIV